MSDPASARRSCEGFTLIELLVVLSIIALLVAILLPALQSARETARQIVCGSNEKQIYLAMVAYANDYDGLLPPGQWEEPTPGKPLGEKIWNGILKKERYLPEWKGSFWSPTGAIKNTDFEHVLFCPSAVPNNEATYGTDYSMNVAAAAANTEENMNEPKTYAGIVRHWVRLGQYPNLIILGDAYGMTSFSDWHFKNGFGRFRHGGNGNIGVGNFIFDDGHVETFRHEARMAMWAKYCRR